MEKEDITRYVEQGLNNSQIAKLISCHRTTVPKKMKKFGIVRNKNKNVICKLCKKDLGANEKNDSKCYTCATRVRRYRTKFAAVKYKGGICEHCGWIGSIAAFDFHHIDANKEFTLKSCAHKKWDLIKKELDKCKLLCSNCHRIEHAKHNDDLFLNEIKKYNGNNVDFF
jgi:uncharacterized CHY-type Zn-finger protein